MLSLQFGVLAVLIGLAASVAAGHIYDLALSNAFVIAALLAVGLAAAISTLIALALEDDT